MRKANLAEVGGLTATGINRKSVLNAAPSTSEKIALMKTVSDLKPRTCTQKGELMLLATHGARESVRFYYALWQAKLP